MSSHLSGLEQDVPNVDYNLPIDYNKAGRLLADWVITNDTTAHVLVIVSDEIVSTASMKDGISSEFDTYGGPDIEYDFVNVPIPEWGTKIKPAVQSAIVADPDLTYVVCIYDSMSQFVTPAIDATNSADQVKVIGFNGTPFVVDLVREGKVEMDIGDSLNWAGMAIADAEMRLIGDMGLVDEHQHPVPALHQGQRCRGRRAGGVLQGLRRLQERIHHSSGVSESGQTTSRDSTTRWETRPWTRPSSCATCP